LGDVSEIFSLFVKIEVLNTYIPQKRVLKILNFKARIDRIDPKAYQQIPASPGYNKWNVQRLKTYQILWGFSIELFGLG